MELHGVVFSLSVRSARKLRMHDIEYGRRQSGRAFRIPQGESNSPPDRFLNLILGTPKFKSSAMLVK